MHSLVKLLPWSPGAFLLCAGEGDAGAVSGLAGGVRGCLSGFALLLFLIPPSSLFPLLWGRRKGERCGAGVAFVAQGGGELCPQPGLG